MSTISDTKDAGELIAVIAILLLLAKLTKLGANSLNNFLTEQGFFAGPPVLSSWVATPKPLTPGHADGLAKFIGIEQHGGGWKLSPDGTQIWFFDGSFFDNKSGHFFDANGNDLGDLLGNPGSSGGQVVTGIDTTQMDPANMALMGA